MDINRRYLDAPQIRAVKDEDRVIEFVASDGSVDSYGTVLPVDGWDLERYSRNGVVGYQHDIYGGFDNDPDNVIGRGEAFVEDGQLIVRVAFEPKDLNERADKIYRKVKFGSISGVSVGFAPKGVGHWGSEDRGENPEVYYFAGQELLEVSVVNIPSNKNAVKRSIDQERAALPEKKREAAEPEVLAGKPEEALDNSYLLTVAKAQCLLANNQR